MPVCAADAQAVESALSKERLSTYVRTLKTSNTRHALSLYAWNAKISGAFMLPQQICEVAVRNAASEVLGQVYGPQWPWSISFERSLPDPHSGFSMRKEMESARSKARSRNAGAVIPELKFAFWGKLFTHRFDDRLWLPHLLTSFPGLPAGRSPAHCRQMIFDALEGVRKIRNRIAHHEPIFARSLVADLERMINLVSWRCPRTAAWLSKIEGVSALLSQRP
ncbi:hypothetical protein HX881_28020 [Pseudomonas gingeri]|uniref:hypothetical protein n=1 Tax=Pseudomonas gingeri TaxID=117681 RepID=UPI0015A43FF4|nr:hypothetical protein [Pseudomonas gingeri]